MLHLRPGMLTLTVPGVCLDLTSGNRGDPLCLVWWCVLPKWGQPCHPGDSPMKAFSPSLLAFSLSFLKCRSLFFILGDRKQNHIPLQIPWIKHCLHKGMLSFPNVHILIILYKLFSAFLSPFFTVFSFFSGVSEIFFQSHGKMNLKRSRPLWF